MEENQTITNSLEVIAQKILKMGPKIKQLYGSCPKTMDEFISDLDEETSFYADQLDCMLEDYSN